MFSVRTAWHRQPNRLSELLEARRKSGIQILDLTISNPTEVGIHYPAKEILAALSHPQALHYAPDPKGLRSAREAIAAYYGEKKIHVDPSTIVLTASTSEAYAMLFTLLCNAGEEILVPVPSYPLFEFLARLHDVRLRPYYLRYDGEWHLDAESVRTAVTSLTKAVIVVHPHNPTGMFAKRDELAMLNDVCRSNNLALIVDEVFSEYSFGEDERRVHSTPSNSDVLTFTLNGISKLCGLPQLKLGWVVVSGNDEARNEALHRLEIIADTFLSVHTPVQVALPALLNHGKNIRRQIGNRVRSNYSLVRQVQDQSPLTALSAEGGWYALLKVPKTKTEEEWSLELLANAGVYVFPGYFFEFAESNILVVSLLTNEEVFRKGLIEIVRSVK
jgi:aspartate/methionine/tyrosine aminotransferase